jgi:AcrR family transcriptional regulator
MSPRKDSSRNRALLVAAAREVFAERGLGVTLDDIAERAGLGTGTAYRHFRNKHEIAAEVLADATQQIVSDAEHALSIDDPWLAVVSFFEATARRQAADRGLYQSLAGQGNVDDKSRIWPQIVSSVTTLFTRAKRAGVIRADASPEDAALIFAMLGVIFDMGGVVSADLWRRYLAILLDGLRATDRPPLPVPAPAFATLDQVIAAGKHHGASAGGRSRSAAASDD